MPKRPTPEQLIGRSGQQYVIRAAFREGRKLGSRGRIVRDGFDVIAVYRMQNGETFKPEEWAYRTRTVRAALAWIKGN